QHRVDSPGQAGLAGYLAGIDGVESDLLGEDLLLHRAGQAVPDLRFWPWCVQQQRGAWRRPAQPVGPLQQLRLMAADEAGTLHEVGRADGLRAEAEVRYGLRARLLGVVDEIPLRVQPIIRAENLDGVLVRADGAVRAEAEEEGADRAGRRGVQVTVVQACRAE